MQNWGKKLKVYKVKAGMTSYHLGQRLGVSGVAVDLWVNGCLQDTPTLRGAMKAFEDIQQE